MGTISMGRQLQLPSQLFCCLPMQTVFSGASDGHQRGKTHPLEQLPSSNDSLEEGDIGQCPTSPKQGECLWSCCRATVLLADTHSSDPKSAAVRPKGPCPGRCIPTGLPEGLNSIQGGAHWGIQQIFAINQLSGVIYLVPKLTSGLSGDDTSVLLLPKAEHSEPKQYPARKRCTWPFGKL